MNTILKNKYIYKKFFFYKNILNKKIFINKKIINKSKKSYRILKKKLLFTHKYEIKEIECKVKFCVFAGREKNIKILHFYIHLLLDKFIINEYHIFDFTRNKDDHEFILDEFNKFKNIYPDRIFLHNYDNNKSKILGKNDWSPFYKIIQNICSEKDILIKCDDDILFIDIFGLKNAIKDRKNDKYSFIIHSNCINNGVCAYYQRHLYDKLKEKLNIYPTGGILGILFEKPEFAYAIHNQFYNDLYLDINNINKYVIEDVYITSRISINFILINGSDIKYLKDISTDDEYELSSFIPEKLLRPNKIKGDLITSHLSYVFQEKIILHRDNILSTYLKLKEKYEFDKDLIKNYNSKILPILICNYKDNIFKIKNWFNNNHYYIKNAESDKYLLIDYFEDEAKLSDINKTIFEIIPIDENSVEIKLGIYYITRYNIIGKFKNENILLKYLRDDTEKYIIKESSNNNSFYLKFKKYNNYLSYNNELNIDISNIAKNRWIFEKVNLKDTYIECNRFEKNKKFYYKNIKTNEEYTNYYLGWGNENLLI